MVPDPQTRNFAVVLLVVTFAVAAVAPSIHAQWTRRPPPLESAYWWTLSDEVTPSELRHALQDRAAIRERYRRSVEAGHTHQVVTEQDIHEVSAYLDGAENPELIPMYLAFVAFAQQFKYDTNWKEESAELLHRYGMSTEGSDLLMAVVLDYRAAKDQIVAEARQPVDELMRILDPLAPELGDEHLTDLLYAGDLRKLSRLTGREVAELARLHRQWKRVPFVEASLPRLVKLRRDLSSSDWSALRTFLLREVAPMLSAVDFRRGNDS